MGILEPQHLLVLLIVFFTPFSIWGYQVGKNRTIGGIGGLLLGFFFNFLGIIIAYSFNKNQSYDLKNLSPADELKKYKELLDTGAITEIEYNTQKQKILNSK